MKQGRGVAELAVCYVSWVRNVTLQFRAPHWDSPKAPCCSLSLPLVFPSPFLLCWSGVENYRHKRQTSHIEIRAIYGQQQWDKKTNSNSKCTKERVIYLQNVYCRAQPDLTTVMFFWLVGTPFSSGESFPPSLAVMQGVTEWHLGLSPAPSQLLQKENPVLAKTRTLWHVKSLW